MAKETLKNFYIRYNTTADLKGTRQVKGELKDVAGQSKKVGKSFKGFAKSGPLAVTAILAVGTAAVAVAAKFAKLSTEMDKSRQQMIGLVGLSPEVAGMFSKEATSIAAKYGQSVLGIGRAFYAVTSAGYRGSEAMQIVDSAAKGALIGLGETDDIVKLLTLSLEVFKKDGLTASDALDQLAGAARAANADADALGGILPALGVHAKNLGVDFGETAALAAIMTKSVKDIGEIKTQIQAMFIAFNQTSTVKALKELGIPLQEFHDLVREDVLSALELLETTMRDKFGETSGYGRMLQKLFPRVNAKSAFQVLVGDLESGRAIVDQVANSLGTTDEAMNSVMMGTAELGKQFTTLQTKLGELFLPTIHSLTKTMGEMVTFLNENDEAIINLATTFNDILTPAIKEALKVFQGTVRVVNYLVTALQHQGFLHLPNAPEKSDSKKKEEQAKYYLNTIEEETAGMTKSEAQAWLRTPRGRALASRYRKAKGITTTKSEASTESTPVAPEITSTARPIRAPITFTGTGSVAARETKAFNLGSNNIPSQLQELDWFRGIVLASREAEFMAEALRQSTDALLDFGDELAGVLSNAGLGGAGRALSSVTGAFDTARSVGGAFKAAQRAVDTQGGIDNIVSGALSSAGPLGIIAGGVTLIGGLFKTFSRRSEKRAKRQLEEQQRQSALLAASLNPYRGLRGQSLGDIGKYWTGGGFNSMMISGSTGRSESIGMREERLFHPIGIIQTDPNSLFPSSVNTQMPSAFTGSTKVEAPISITVNASPGMDESAVAREVQSKLTQQFRQTVADFG